MRPLIVLLLFVTSTAFAGAEAEYPEIARIKALDIDTVAALYRDSLQEMHCQVDYKDAEAKKRLFQTFLAKVYELAKVPAESLENNSVVGAAAEQKDKAYFKLEADGKASFNKETLIMTLNECSN